MSDSPGVSGPPGIGTTSAGWRTDDDPWAAWEIPLGAYPQSVSPWGLLDTSGGADEWNEQIFGPDYPRERGLMGSYAGDDAPAWQFYDRAWGAGSHGPDFASHEGLRIAAPVPAPGSIVAVLCGFLLGARRSTRRI